MADRRIISPDDSGYGWVEVRTPDVVVADSLRVPNTIIAPSGVAFPGAPTAEEWFWRSDTTTLYRRNSTNTAWDPISGAVALGAAAFYPHGFVNQTDSSLTFVPGTSTLTVTTVSGYDFYYQGNLFHKSANDSIVVGVATGLHFIYYDATGALVDSLVPWNLQTAVPVATIYWNNTVTDGVFGDERHMSNMSWSQHYYLHTTIGTRFHTGLAASGYALDTDTDAAVTFGLSAGGVLDEDIPINITHAAVPTNRFEQYLTDPAKIPVFYRTGASGEWVWDAPVDFYFKNVAGGNQRVSWNQFTLGAWQQTEAASANYVAYWIFATNHWLNPVISIQGQREDSNLTNARLNNTLDTLSFGSLPFQEMKLLYRMIVRTNNGYGGTRKAMLSDVSDFRAVSTVAGNFVPANHASLGDLNTSGHPATIIHTTSGGWGKNLKTTDTDVQLALQSTDEHTHAIKAGIVLKASFAGNPRKATVTFTTPYPDTNYSIAHVIYTDGSSNAAFIATVENKTVNGFDLSLHSGNINDVIDVEWITKPVGE